MLAGLAALHCTSTVQALTQNEVSFALYKTHFKKTYTAAEEEARFAAFEASLARVATSGNPASGLTQYSDMTPEDFKNTYARARGRALPSDAPRATTACPACKRFPEHATANYTDFDWTTKGAVTPVKDQGLCGSCWSFGTTGDIEGTWFLAGHDLEALSEQQLVSCETTNEGCHGGWQYRAFDWVIQNGGIASEADYPYVSLHGAVPKCEVNHKEVANISKWYQVSSNASTEADIATQLVKAGPISVAMDAAGMQDYKSGIDSPKAGSCSPTTINHVVLVVGFGTEGGVDYWKIKNSWSTNFGEDGYYRIVRGQNKCGVAMDAFHSVV